jgi:hypothetical protein
MDDVPEQELMAVARQVADEIIATLKHLELGRGRRLAKGEPR